MSSSLATGSVKPPSVRNVSVSRDSWVVVATYAQTMPAGHEEPRRGLEALPRRQHVEDHPVDHRFVRLA